MKYYVTDRVGQVHEFDNWLDAIKFAIQQAKLNPQIPVDMQWGKGNSFKYQVWADGVINRLEKHCACDQCPICTHPDGSTACPYYWERKEWEYFDTLEL